MNDSNHKKAISQYFDTEDFNLAKNDIWLRKRNESFELMLPIFGNEKEIYKKYQKIEGEEKIREIFAIARLKSFTEDIADLGYVSFFDVENSISEGNFSLERKNVLEFLKTKKPDQYQALAAVGVVVE